MHFALKEKQRTTLKAFLNGQHISTLVLSGFGESYIKDVLPVLPLTPLCCYQVAPLATKKLDLSALNVIDRRLYQ